MIIESATIARVLMTGTTVPRYYAIITVITCWIIIIIFACIILHNAVLEVIANA